MGRALHDLGANINLMSLSVYKTLGIGGARPMTVTFQLTYRSIITYPKEKIEDILVQVDKLIFPIDFIILDYLNYPRTTLFGNKKNFGRCSKKRIDYESVSEV